MKALQNLSKVFEQFGLLLPTEHAAQPLSLLAQKAALAYSVGKFMAHKINLFRFNLKVLMLVS
jgi:hypothetical protein